MTLQVQMGKSHHIISILFLVFLLCSTWIQVSGALGYDGKKLSAIKESDKFPIYNVSKFEVVCEICP